MTGTLYKNVGEKIRELRTQLNGRGISQEGLAAEMGTTPNTISRWETATYKPRLADLEKLARFFGVPITTFFPGVSGDVRSQALLSATSNLDDEDFDELVKYAQFRKALRDMADCIDRRAEKRKRAAKWQEEQESKRAKVEADLRAEIARCEPKPEPGR